MSTRTVLLIVIGAAIVVIGGLGTMVYVSRGFFSDALHVFAEGSAFGRGKNSRECVDEAVRRYDPKQDMLRQTRDSGFVVACLAGSHSADDVCGSVPQTSLVNQAPARAWADAECRERNLEGQGCALIFLQVANYCRAKR
jgi:hypothetical protein